MSAFDRRALLAMSCAAALAASCARDAKSLAPFPCAADGSCPTDYVCVDQAGCLPANECDVRAANCSDPQRTRCTVVRAADQKNYTVCVAPTGAAKLGESCSRVGLGLDDCDHGLFCNNGFSPDGSFACRRFCKSNLDCASGFVCAHPFAVVTDGICVPACQFGADGCGAQHTCRAISTDGFACMLDGPAREWARCDGTTACAHGLDCFGGNPGICRRLCTSSNGCAAGDSCYSIAGSYGTCECDLYAGCAFGSSCRPNGSDANGALGTCESDGNGLEGASCTYDTDCGSNLVCWGSQQRGYKCTAVCDQDHRSCSVGSCHPLNGLANGGGVCE